jgi:hypothetical protein
LQVVQQFVAELAAFGHTDAPPKRVDRNIHVMLHPRPRQQRGKVASPKAEAPPHSPGPGLPKPRLEPPPPPLQPPPSEGQLPEPPTQ